MVLCRALVVLEVLEPVEASSVVDMCIFFLDLPFFFLSPSRSLGSAGSARCMGVCGWLWWFVEEDDREVSFSVEVVVLDLLVGGGSAVVNKLFGIASSISRILVRMCDSYRYGTVHWSRGLMCDGGWLRCY
jgi:hypothetical protein